jgi:hypothetical protein
MKRQPVDIVLLGSREACEATRQRLVELARGGDGWVPAVTEPCQGPIYVRRQGGVNATR